MANTSPICVRMEPTLKNEVEDILNQLGVTPSSLVQMLYNQIRLTKSIPFEIGLSINDGHEEIVSSKENISKDLKSL